MKRFIDYYSLLGIDRKATEDSIKTAYKNLAKQYHPDSHPKATPEEIKELEKNFSQITKAYSILSDVGKRYSYNLKYDEIKERKNSEPIKIIKPNIRKIYKDIKEEEKKYSFSKRHHIYDNEIYEDYYEDQEYLLEHIMFQLLRGVIHISKEFMYNLNKLVETRDSFTEYVIRNRKSIAGIIVAISVTPFLFEHQKVEPINPEPIKVTDENKDEFQSVYYINRYYTVQAGDTLSQLALDANTSVTSIKQCNELGELLLMGEKIMIPYKILEEDLNYCTTTKEFSKNTTLEEYAQEHYTDVESLIKLNKEAIIKQDNTYCVLSDTLVVPTFEAKSEINELKQVQENQKIKNNQ